MISNVVIKVVIDGSAFALDTCSLIIFRKNILNFITSTLPWGEGEGDDLDKNAEPLKTFLSSLAELNEARCWSD